MHPVIRVVIFFVLVSGATFGHVLQLAMSSLLLILGFSLIRWQRFQDNFAMLKRMRWLFLSILITYLWFTPGERLFPALNAWSPGLEGLETGLYRVFSLVVIVLAVNLLVKSVNRDELVAAIVWLLRPFSVFGLPLERLGIRIALVFEIISDVQTIYERQKSDSKEGATPKPVLAEEEGKASGISVRAGTVSIEATRLFQTVLDHAEVTTCHEVEVEINGSPPLYQWSYPLLLLSLFYFSLNLLEVST